MPSKYNHKATDLWEACGFDSKAQDIKLQSLSPTFNALNIPSKIIEFIEKMDRETLREKLTLAFYVCQVKSAKQFQLAMEEARKVHLETIEQLGGSHGSSKVPRKKSRNKRS